MHALHPHQEPDRTGIQPHPRTVPLHLPLTAPAGRSGSAAPDLVGYATLAMRNLGLIFTCTVACLLLALGWVMVAPPVYESAMLFQVEEPSPAAQRNSVSDLSTAFEKKAAPLAEMELLRSRSVLGAAVDQLQLDLESKARYVPLLGPFSVRFGRGQRAVLAGGHVWGAQSVQLARLEVPEAWLGQALQLTVLDDQRVRLADPDGATVLEGAPGAELTGQGRAGPVRLHIRALDALPGARFTVRRQRRQGVIDALQQQLQVSEQGKGSGILEVRLQGREAAPTSAILTALAQAFLAQNLARKQQEASLALGFVSDKLPALTRRLEQSEERLHQLRTRYGSIDLSEETRLGLQQGAQQRQMRDELQQKRIELLSRFLPGHPQVQAIEHQMAAIDARLGANSGYLHSLPKIEQEQVRLQRAIHDDSELVGGLSKTAEQLRIVAAGKASNVRLVDPPQATELPVGPRPAVTLASAGVTGLFLGLLAAVLRHSWRGAINDTAALAAMLGGRAVYASIPHSKTQQRHPRALLACAAPNDPAIEGLRSFRAALLYAMPYFHNNVVLISGASAGVGQSFVLANVAALLGAAGKRVLLLDADLRHGRLHQYFQRKSTPGLGDVLGGASSLEHVLHSAVSDGVDFVACGQQPPGQTEYLVHLNFHLMLEELGSRYDVVLIGAAPLLDSADALAIGSRAGAVFVLTRAGLTREDQLHEAVLRLNQAGIAPQGVLCNDLPARLGQASAPALRAAPRHPRRNATI